MHSFLIVGRNEKEKEKQIKRLIRKLEVDLVEFSLSKIEETRALNSFLKLRISHPTAVLIKNVDKATSQALNAFLKGLEEPQENVSFILTANSAYKLLPTIVSRCQIITAKVKKSGSEKAAPAAKGLLKMPEAEKLAFINSIRSRDEAVLFLEAFIIDTHKELLTTKKSRVRISSSLKTAHLALNSLKANGNVGLQLTNFVINL